ncbi:MAG: quinone oxidoreductase [Planctomycetota bacterium]|nr:MAG: quinone oxidoreductase [Planctomycetota bacterium]
MRAYRLTGFGEDSRFEEFDKPDVEPGPNQVAIQVHATSVNPVDTKIRAGFAEIAPDPPVVLGCDVAGVVVAVGPGVRGLAVGDEVFGCAGGVKGHDGAYSERMVADERLLALKPKTLSFREAAALPLVSITAWEALVDRAQVAPGDRVLIHGGTGGVGHVGVQLARVRGAIVDTTVGSDAKAEIAKELGADQAILYRQQTVDDYVASNTGGAGYDVVFDTVGGANLQSSIQALAINGRCATTVSVDSQPDLTNLHVKNASLHVVFMLIPMLTMRDFERHGEVMKRVATLVDRGRIRPLVDKMQFELSDLEAAHRHLLSGKAVGKVVVEVRHAG